jgi:hypothetical protein
MPRQRTDLAHPERPNKPLSTHREQRPLLLSALITGGEDFFQGDFAGPFPEFPDTGNRFVDLFLPATRLRHNPSDGTAMPRNNEGLTALNIIKELG